MVGVAKSISTPSLPCSFPSLPAPLLFRGDLRTDVCLRLSSNGGMFCTGETGTVGFRIDFRGTEAADWKESQVDIQYVNSWGRNYHASVAIGVLERI